MLFNSYAVHFPVPAGRPARLFRARPPQQSGPGGLADAGLAGVLCLWRLAVRAAAAGLDRFQLRRRLSPDRAQAFAPCTACRTHGRRHRRSRGARHLQICGLLRRQSQRAVFDRLHRRASLLPVGISFYTFTQIAFLVDAYRGNVARYALPHYALFVTYFPHLIAGPILHHKDMIPQFERAEAKRPDPHLILCGLIIFAIGLFKKTCLADGIQPLVVAGLRPQRRRPSIRPGSARWPTRSSSISISPAIPTWRSACR